MKHLSAKASDGMVLTPEHGSWVKWQEYVDAELARNGVCHPEPTIGVDLLRKYIPLESKPRAFVSQALASLGVAVRTQRDSEALPGQGLFKISKRVELAGEWQRPEVHVNTSNAFWDAFTSAHELGHVVLYTFLTSSRTSDEYKAEYADYEASERYCNRFASLVIGIDERDAVRPGVELLLELERSIPDWGALGDEARYVQQKTDSIITFPHILRIARIQQERTGRPWSIRRTIRWLNKSAVLDHAEDGIALMRVQANRKTKQAPALRLWQVALPTWAYLPTNQRAVNRGFVHAQEAFDRVAARKVWACTESLRVEENAELLGLRAATRFIKRRLETTCAYTPVDVTGEGRYLIAIWDWPTTRVTL